jgi:hypothetical protein
MAHLKFSLVYFIPAVLLFITEVFIALYMHDAVIRPFGGDFLVVILIYCSIKSIFNTPVLSTAIVVLLFAYAVEVSQYFHLVYVLGLGGSSLAKALLGTSFSFTDLFMYTLGTMTVLIAEHLKTSLKNF